jgi:hypothetical protein
MPDQDTASASRFKGLQKRDRKATRELDRKASVGYLSGVPQVAARKDEKMDRHIVREATENAVERLTAKVEKARSSMIVAVESYATAQQELALAIDRLERMREQDPPITYDHEGFRR